jgi:hypothetical protein
MNTRIASRVKGWARLALASAREMLPGSPAASEASGGHLDARRRLEAALEWIEAARAGAGDGGLSKGYDALRDRWYPSYPETTGYTIPTLLNAATLLDRADLQEMALSLSDYLLENTTSEGGVTHWAGSNSAPIVFDTGQVIFGWLAALGASGDGRYLQAATRAGDWLASVQDPSGCWTRYQHLGVEKTIDTRVAWALLELYRHTGQDTHRRAAVLNLEWAGQQQDDDGWFRHCSLCETRAPSTHAIAYTAEGLLECGCLLGDARFVQAARLTADALLARQRPDGSLCSAYGPAWRTKSHSTCLTGNCQVAGLWLRICQIGGGWSYRAAGRSAIAFTARTQSLTAANPGTRGAIAGSHPVCGRYERFGYPNWATKFYVDGLLLLLDPAGDGASLPYVG